MVEGDGKFLFVPLHLPLFFKHNFNGMVGIWKISSGEFTMPAWPLEEKVLLCPAGSLIVKQKAISYWSLLGFLK